MSIRNNATNRSYVAEYVISAGQANADTLQDIVIPGDVTGTWTPDNSVALYVGWTLFL